MPTNESVFPHTLKQVERKVNSHARILKCHATSCTPQYRLLGHRRFNTEWQVTATNCFLSSNLRQKQQRTPGESIVLSECLCVTTCNLACARKVVVLGTSKRLKRYSAQAKYQIGFGLALAENKARFGAHAMPIRRKECNPTDPASRYKALLCMYSTGNIHKD